MSDQPEALRLADELHKAITLYSAALENGDMHMGLMAKAAAELRRLHAVEADFHMAYRMKCDAETKRLQAERDALLAEVERLKRVNYDLAGDLTVMSATKQMQAAIDAAKGDV